MKLSANEVQTFTVCKTVWGTHCQGVPHSFLQIADCFVVSSTCALQYQSPTCLTVVTDLALASQDLGTSSGVFISFLMPREPNELDLLQLRRSSGKIPAASVQARKLSARHRSAVRIHLIVGCRMPQ